MPDVPSYEDALARSSDRPAFSNGTEWDIWSYRNCMRCLNDGIGTDQDIPQCPLILVALSDRTPQEWTDQSPPFSDYRCSMFRERDSGLPE